MRYVKYIFLLLFVCSWWKTAVSFLNPTEVISYAYDLYKCAVNDGDFSFKDRILKKLQISDASSTLKKNNYHELLVELSSDYHDLKDSILYQNSNAHLDKITQKTDLLFGLARDIEFQYKQFLEYHENSKYYLLSEIMEFTETISSSKLQKLKRKIENMHEVLVGLDFKKQNIVNMIADKNLKNEFICLHEISPQQLIIRLFDMVSQTHLKGLMIILYSYNIREAYTNSTFYYSKNKEFNNYIFRVNNTFKQVQPALFEASREIIKCDPKIHVKDITYTKLDVFQGYFVYEGDLTRSYTKSVLNSCASIVDEKLKCKTSACKHQSQEKKCNGRLRNCETIHKPKSICHSRGERRYTWMETESGLFYGYYDNCLHVQNFTHSFINMLNYCLCNCENVHLETTRHFSLLDVISDIENNKVITGIRFREINKIIYIQIQQGKLTNRGNIEGIPEWKNVTEVPLLEYIKTHNETIKENSLFVEELLKKLYSVSYEQNTVMLDDVSINSKTLLVTGLRFREKNDMLFLEIRLTPFDFITGQINLDKYLSYWINRDDRSIKYKQEVVPKFMEDPTRLPRSTVFSEDNQFFHFETTSTLHDLGQSTVPFVDIQEVVTSPPMPLSGVGIYHKGGKQSGGFMGFKLIHFDYSHLMYQSDN